MTIVVATNLFLYLLSFRKKVKMRGDTTASFPTSSSHYFNFFQEIGCIWKSVLSLHAKETSNKT